MTQSFTGHLPYTDEMIERVDNSEHIQVGTIGTKRVTLFDSNGNEISMPSASSSFVSGALALTNAGTAVQVLNSNVAIKFVDVCANGGPIAVGDSGVVQTSGSEVGNIIYPANLPHRILITNINKLYAAGPTGTRITYVYYV